MQDIAWIYYISLLAKHFITYCWKTCADWYQGKIIITTTKIFLTIFFTWLNQLRAIEKNSWKDVSYTGTKNQAPRNWQQEGAQQSQAYKTEYQLCLPFVIYADFKSVLHKRDWCEPSSSKSFITQYEHHLPRGSYVYVKCSDGQYFEPPQLNIGDDAAERFLDQVSVASTICRQNLTKKISMKQLAQEQRRDYNNATNYSICTKPFRPTDKKVHNHHHLTIEYGCPAQNACNLNYHTRTFLFNIRNY